MVEIKSIQIAHKTFVGVHLYMPGYPLYFIMSTKTMLAPALLNLEYFQKENHVAVILVSNHNGFEALLEGSVVAMNTVARQRGVTIGMIGEEAMYLCVEKD